MRDLTMSDMILLGLIGDNIAASQSPRLHRLAGVQNGRQVRYDSLIPALEGLDFDALFARCAAGGYRYPAPFKRSNTAYNLPVGSNRLRFLNVNLVLH